MTGSRVWVCLFVTTLAAGCGVETVVHDITEKEANGIIVLLAQNEIEAGKGMRDTGRQVFYSINVSPSKRLEALRILEENDFPRRKIKGYGEVFQEGGLIPTSAEEKAKKLLAIEGEIEKQLTLIQGILDAQVNVVLPEESALRTAEDAMTPTKASVTVKYMPGKGGTKPLHEPQVRALVAAAVEKLTTDHVEVLMTAAKEAEAVVAAECPQVPGGRGKGIFGKLPERTQKLLLVGIIIFILILSLMLAFGQMRLRNVRGRLIRLQNEIAKARRRPPEGGVPAPVD